MPVEHGIHLLTVYIFSKTSRYQVQVVPAFEKDFEACGVIDKFMVLFVSFSFLDQSLLFQRRP